MALFVLVNTVFSLGFCLSTQDGELRKRKSEGHSNGKQAERQKAEELGPQFLFLSTILIGLYVVPYILNYWFEDMKQKQGGVDRVLTDSRETV